MSTQILVDAKDTIIGIEASAQPIEGAILLEDVHQSPFVGRPLFSVISGDATRLWLGGILQHVRYLNRSRTYDYRCDSPQVKRWCRMEVGPVGTDGTVAFRHSVLRVEKNHLPILRETRVSTPHTRCSVCCRFVYDGCWVDPDDYILLTRSEPASLYAPGIRFDICPNCQTVTPSSDGNSADARFSDSGVRR